MKPTFKESPAITSLAWALVVSLLLDPFAIFSNTWFMLVLDLNNCQACGGFIVGIGQLIENSTTHTDYRTVNDVIVNETELSIDFDDTGIARGIFVDNDSSYRYVIDETHTLTLFGDDPEDVYESDFEVADSLYVALGLRSSKVCTKDLKKCVTVDLHTIRGLLGGLQTLLCIIGKSI